MYENKKFLFYMLPNPQKMLTDAHRDFWMILKENNMSKNAQKTVKTGTFAQIVRMSERYLITVYIYISFFDAFHPYGERCNFINVH
jgi:hypothetical protein